MTTSRRFPVWVTLLPLVAAIGLYGLLWRGWADDFRAEINALLPGASLDLGGFPYRLEIATSQPRLALGSALRLEIAADSARINRGPWRPNPSVIRLESPRASVVVSPAIAARISAAAATASINWGEGRLRRQSSILQAATLSLGTSPLAITADTLELHLREVQGDPVPQTSPRREAHGQLVISASRLRFADGDALTLSAEILATAAARLTDYARWADGGTLELTRLTMADAHGEILSLSATLTPGASQTLDIAGAIETICPAALAAAFSGAAPAPEKRLRVPVRLALAGQLDAPRLVQLPDLQSRPRRTQEPDCPRLRG